jgi:hypothetical protein
MVEVHRILIFVLVWFFVAVDAFGASTNAGARLSAVAPCAGLVAAAQARNIPLDGIDPVMGGDRLDPGDTISALITLFEKGDRRKQWLVYLEVAPPTAEEAAQKPKRPMVMYSSFGGTQACVSAPAFVVVRTLGPFVDGPRRGKPAKVPEKSARFELNKGFLGLGLHHAAAAFQALEQGRVRGTWTVRHTPFSEEQLAKGRASAAQLQLTAERERAMIGAIPALMSYFDVVRNSPGLSDIFFEVVDLPSAWSLLRNAGIRSVGLKFGKGVEQTSGARWSLPEAAPVYHFPVVLDLNDHTALKSRFVATSPDSPLLACAGVVGLLAENPRDPEKYLTLRIISARRSSASKL